MRRFDGRFHAGLVLACFLSGALVAGTPEPWVSPRTLDLAQYLAPPPAADSPAQRADLDAVLAVQEARTDAAIEEAKADQVVSVFRFADVLGAAFTPERLPKTAALAAEACRQSATVTAAAKRFWNRPRPFLVSRQVSPVVSNATQGAYPSGHATCGYLWAILLADMIPERKTDLFARGVRYGTNRVVGGVHYPSDVEAGRLSAVAVASALFAAPGFRAELETARTELRRALGYAGTAGSARGE